MAHGVVAIVLLAGGVVHALCVTDDLHDLPAGLAFLAAAAVGLVAWATYRASPAVSGRGAHWTVESVRRETRNVRTLTLRPPADERRMTFLPGQFCFLRPVGPGLPHEDHPFTVASAPSAEGCVSFTIKASGDFTQAIQSVKVGRPMSLSAPYGRFSYLLQPDETDLVFIAGGIGITPLMGMIRHMQSTGADREVLLLYGSRTEEDIAFREELADLGAGHVPRLRVVHVLSRPSSGWGGEVGRIDREKVARLCGAVEGKGFYVCGPREMMRDVTRALRSLGAPRSRIHYEQFEL